MTASAPGGPRLLLNAAACDGHGICALLCPDRISIDEWGHASLEDRPLDSRRVVRRAIRAVRACPERALQLVPG